jgi:hypothetical protein
MLKLDTEAELVALHTGDVKESLHLEYKDSRAVDKKNDKTKLEMARDVSAFANADGGQIIYGMTEKDHAPDGMDEGLDPKQYPEIWFEQVLQQHVTPLLEQIKPRHIPLSNGNVAVVIDVPPAAGDPHQVDGRYYRRHNFNRLVMEHYEVKAFFNRQTSPSLYLKVELLKPVHELKFVPNAEVSEPVTLLFLIQNRSNTPALYSLVHLLISPKLKITSSGVFSGPDMQTDGGGHSFALYTKKIAIPAQFPLFKEAQFSLNDRSFHVAFPRVGYGYSEYYPMVALLTCPGCRTEQRWRLRQLNDQVTLETQ